VVCSADIQNRVFIRETWADRVSTDQIYAQIYRINEKYKLDIFGVEAAGQQTLFVDSIIRDAMEKRISIPIRGIPVPTSVTKEFRIRTSLQPLLPHGRLFLKPDQTDLREELLSFPMSQTVDLVDALAGAVSLIPRRYSLNEDLDEKQAYLQYLRESGAPFREIERVASGIRNEEISEDYLDYFNSRERR